MDDKGTGIDIFEKYTLALCDKEYFLYVYLKLIVNRQKMLIWHPLSVDCVG